MLGDATTSNTPQGAWLLVALWIHAPVLWIHSTETTQLNDETAGDICGTRAELRLL